MSFPSDPPVRTKSLYQKILFLIDGKDKKTNPLFYRTIHRAGKTGKNIPIYDASLWFSVSEFGKNKPKKITEYASSGNGQVDQFLFHPFEKIAQSIQIGKINQKYEIGEEIKGSNGGHAIFLEAQEYDSLTYGNPTVSFTKSEKITGGKTGATTTATSEPKPSPYYQEIEIEDIIENQEEEDFEFEEYPEDTGDNDRILGEIGETSNLEIRRTDIDLDDHNASSIVTQHYNGFQRGKKGEWAGVKANEDTGELRLVVDFSTVLTKNETSDLFDIKPTGFIARNLGGNTGVVRKKLNLEFTRENIFAVSKTNVKRNDYIGLRWRLKWENLLTWKSFAGDKQQIGKIKSMHRG